jgi:hypothetical protein
MTNIRTAAPEHRPQVGEASRSIGRAGVVAGLALLLMAVLAGYGNIVVVEGLVTPGDAAKTADDILGAQTTFRLGVTSLYLVVVLDVIVAWALMKFFNPVRESLSRLAAWFRLAYAGVFMVAISQLAGIPDLLNADGSAFTPDQVQTQALQKVDAFNDIWFAGLILFAVHLVLIGYLAYRSGYVPRLLGVLVVIAGLGYAFDSLGTVFSSSPPVVSTVTFLGEFLLCIWLLIRGRRITLTHEEGRS